MRICYIADANSPHSSRWIGYFAERGHRINWISLSAPAGDLPAGVDFHLIKTGKAKWLKILAAGGEVKKLVKKIKPDILHAHYAGVNGVLGAACGFHPYVLTAWGSDILFAAKKFPAGVLIRSALKKADLITCDSFRLRDEMKKFGLPEDKIKIVNFGVETKEFCPGPVDGGLKERLGTKNCLSVISARGLAPVYDIGTLLAAAQIAIKENPKLKFIIGGSGPLEAGLKDQAKNLKIENNVVFAGFIPHDELKNWFRATDIYVSTALSDAGIAASTAEAMACGLPAAVSNAAENDRWIKPGQNGFLFPAKDPAALARILIELSENESLRQKIGLAGRQTIVARDDRENEMAKMEKLYEKLV